MVNFLAISTINNIIILGIKICFGIQRNKNIVKAKIINGLIINITVSECCNHLRSSDKITKFKL